MRIKKMLAILTAAMMAVTVAGCSASTQGGSDTGKEDAGEAGDAAGNAAGDAAGKEAEQAKDSSPAGDTGGLQGRSISLMTPYLGSVTTNQMVEYIEQKLKDAGAEVSVINTNNDFSQLASRLEDVVSAGTDGIVLVSADPGQLSNQLQDVFESGIPVFGCDSGFIEGMQVNATSDNYQMGELIVKYLFDDLMGGKGTVIALTHRPHPGVVKRCEAFDDLIKGYPDITLITEQHVPAEQPINDAQDIVENLLLANPDPDSITAIWAAWDEPAIGATQALQEAGRSQVLVTGVDGNEQAIALVKEGTNLKATVKQNFEGMAQIVYEQMDRYFKGEEIEKGELYAPATLITQENADAQ
ncbi:MAG: hypothetical protein ENTB_02266 [Enterocloster aldenensis]